MTCTTTPDRKLRRAYHFDNLATIEVLEIVAHDPVFDEVCAALPQYGVKTKSSLTSTKGMMLIGVASVVCGGDDAATAELRFHWLRVKRLFEDAGIPAPGRYLTANHFREFRDRFLGPDEVALQQINSLLRDVTRSLALKQAEDIGLLRGHAWSPLDGNGWYAIPGERMLVADGTWFLEHSDALRPPNETKKKKKEEEEEGKSANGSKKKKKKKQTRFANRRITRSAKGVKRTSTNVDSRGNAHGYCHVLTSVRGKARRQWIVLDLVSAPDAEEMDHVLPALEAIYAERPGEYFGFAYDGAMRGVHHDHIRSQYGWMSINKPHGYDGQNWLNQRNSRVAPGAKIRDLTFTASDGTACKHRVTLNAGMVWVVEDDLIGVPRRARVMVHSNIRRSFGAHSYCWEMDLTVSCPHHGTFHTLTINPNDEVLLGPNLAEHLRPVPLNDESFWEMFGLRNMIESFNAYLKHSLLGGRRARSLTAARHELDLRLAILTSNALAHAEHYGAYHALPGRGY